MQVSKEMRYNKNSQNLSSKHHNYGGVLKVKNIEIPEELYTTLTVKASQQNLSVDQYVDCLFQQAGII